MTVDDGVAGGGHGVASTGDDNGPARRRGRPPAADALRTRRALVGVAIGHFAEHGYSDATLRSIVEGAGLTTGSVYHYFDSKRDLFIAAAVGAGASLLAVLHQQVPVDANLAAQLAAAIRVNAGMSTHAPDVARFLLHMDTEARRHPELAEVAAEIRSARDDFYRDLVHRAVERGDLARDVDVEGLVDALSVLRDAAARLGVRIKDPQRLRSALTALEQVLFDAVLVGGRDETGARP